jgi:hypothetical protein
VTYDEATRTATLDPVGQLTYDTWYELHVTTEIRDLEGNALPGSVAWTYWVSEDVMPPRIVQLVPADGGVVSPYVWSVAVEFDEGLNESGAAATITLADASGNPVPGSMGWDGWSWVYLYCPLP